MRQVQIDMAKLLRASQRGAKLLEKLNKIVDPRTNVVSRIGRRLTFGISTFTNIRSALSEQIANGWITRKLASN